MSIEGVDLSSPGQPGARNPGPVPPPKAKHHRALEGSSLSAVAERSVLPSVPAELGAPGTLSFL